MLHPYDYGRLWNTAQNNPSKVLKNFMDKSIIKEQVFDKKLNMEEISMKDIFSSPAFQEFLQKRVEEVLTKDEYYNKLDTKILEIEKEFLPMLSDKAKEKYLEIEELTMELRNHANLIIISKLSVK